MLSVHKKPWHTGLKEQQHSRYTPRIRPFLRAGAPGGMNSLLTFDLSQIGANSQADSELLPEIITLVLPSSLSSAKNLMGARGVSSFDTTEYTYASTWKNHHRSLQRVLTFYS